VKKVDLGGVTVSAIGLGTWQFGSREWGYGPDYAEREAPAILRRAIELEVTFVDTAEAYGFGASERIIGRTLAAHRAGGAPVTDLAAEPGSEREATGEDDAARVGPASDRHWRAPFLATKLLPILPIPTIARRSAVASRRRLRVPVIDLYQLHWPNPFVPRRLQAAALRTILDRGIARQVGVSNHSLERWRSIEHALGRPVISDQVRFSLVVPAPGQELVPYARDSGRVVIAYSPLGQGLLARRDVRDRPNDVRRINRQFSRGGLRRSRPLREAVASIAAAHGATPAQVALAWLVGHGNVIAIPGARTVEQLEENAAAGDLELTPDEQARLTRLATELASSR
jgi:aryl-alcohol dehydrogenase-like predicted oxidoreductase